MWAKHLVSSVIQDLNLLFKKFLRHGTFVRWKTLVPNMEFQKMKLLFPFYGVQWQFNLRNSYYM